MEFNTDIFSQYDKKWALVSAGTLEKHNTMTVSWGASALRLPRRNEHG